MKKTLMVLTFALCASFAFAQTATLHQKGEVKAQAKTTAIQNGYTGVSSIFTKDEVALTTVDFHAENEGYTTGTIVGGVEGHSQTADFAFWRRIPNVDSLTLVNEAQIYAYMATWMNGIPNFVSNMQYFADSSVASTANGYMFCSMIDQRSDASGNFNCFIQIDNIDASTATVVDVRFYQFYRKFYDFCYLDYKVNTSATATWQEIEINVTGVDVEVNSNMKGFHRVTLPLEVAGQSDISVRIRYKSLDDHRSNAYGYYWAIDDVSILSCDPDRLRKAAAEEYVEGNYGLIPMGLQVTPAWYSLVQNIGSNPQNNVIATLHHLDATQVNDSGIGIFNNQTIAPIQTKEVIVDKSGLLLPDSLVYRGWYGYADHSTPHGTGDPLPTNVPGDNYQYVTTGNSTTSLTYDTMLYNVTTALPNNTYRWGHDNGVLVYYPTNQWLYGYVNHGGTWYITEDNEDVHFENAGYMVTSRFTTDANVPEGWVIRGVELVASPVNDFHNTGTKISGVLLQDVYDGGNVGFNTVNTGANVKEITSNDVNDENIIGRNSAGYLELGNYRTVVIDFPEQPALEPYTSYRVGYAIEEEGYFCVAREALGSYRLASPSRPDDLDTIIYFRNNEATAKYAKVYKPNQYQSYFRDPIRSNDNSGFAYYSENNPMIRLLIGPAQEVSRVDINVECENTEFGYVTYAGNEVCETTITPVEGSSVSLTGAAGEGCMVLKCIVDGVEVEPWNEDTEEGDPHFILIPEQETETSPVTAIHGRYTFEHVQGNHTIKFVFGELVSIDPVAANVRMNLQPNPATSQVKLNIEGVTGMVNCALIDMSGRVVYSQNINAETAQVINLDGLAKGAYFVRITNDKFSKIEKLIVR